MNLFRLGMGPVRISKDKLKSIALGGVVVLAVILLVGVGSEIVGLASPEGRQALAEMAISVLPIMGVLAIVDCWEIR